MASQVGSVIQDQNLNIHYNGASAGGKTNISKAVKKGGLDGRKPLGDLSNSVKPSLNQALKKQNSNIFSFTEQETGVSKFTLEASKKKSISKAKEKVETGGRRKVLSDISNSGKPSLNGTSKKNQGTKLNVVAEDKIHPSAIAEEGFLHDHNECIKAQTRAMDMDEFLKILGLSNDISKQPETPLATPYLSNLKIGSPTRQMELDEMDEPPLAETCINWKHDSSSDLDSPTCGTPRSPNAHMSWMENKSINFTLIDSP